MSKLKLSRIIIFVSPLLVGISIVVVANIILFHYDTSYGFQKISSLAFSRDSNIIAVGGGFNSNGRKGAGIIDLYSISDGINIVHIFPRNEVVWLAFAPSNQLLSYWDLSSSYCDWNYLSNELKLCQNISRTRRAPIAKGWLDKNEFKTWENSIDQLISTSSSLTPIAVSLDRTLIACMVGSKLKLWKINQDKKLLLWTGHDAVIDANSTSFSDDGRYLISGFYLRSGSSVCEYRLWSTDRGKLIGRLLTHTTTLNVTAFSPDLKYCATSDINGLVEIWDLHTSAIRRSIRVYKSNRVRRVAVVGLHYTHQ